MRSFLIALLALFALSAPAQIALTGSVGVPGNAPILGAQTITMSDANYTLAPTEWDHNFLMVKSSVALTATRSLILPLIQGQEYTVENATSGGQSITLVGSSGSSVMLLNGTTRHIYSDGTGYAQSTPSNPPSLSVAATNASGALIQGPTTTTINLVSCTLGGSCEVPNTCAGASCPNGNQTGVPFSTAQITLSVAAAATDTSFTVNSTSGWPSAGCGRNNTTYEYFCWSSIDATHLYGLTRGFYGSGATAIPSGTNLYGYTATQSLNSTSFPYYAADSNGEALYNLTQLRVVNGSLVADQTVYGSQSVQTPKYVLTPSAPNLNDRTDSFQLTETLDSTTSTNPNSQLVFSHNGTSTGVASVSIPFPTSTGALTTTGTASFNAGAAFPTAGTQPTCNAANRTLLWDVYGNGTTTADTMQRCDLLANGTYAWESVGSGGGGSGGSGSFTSLTVSGNVTTQTLTINDPAYNTDLSFTQSNTNNDQYRNSLTVGVDKLRQVGGASGGIHYFNGTTDRGELVGANGNVATATALAAAPTGCANPGATFTTMDARGNPTNCSGFRWSLANPQASDTQPGVTSLGAVVPFGSTATLPAAVLKVGSVVTIHVYGTATTSSTTEPGQTNFCMSIGTISGGCVNSGQPYISGATIAASSTNMYWQYDEMCTVRSVGTSGTMWCSLSGHNQDGTYGWSGFGGMQALVTLDTTVAQPIAAQFYVGGGSTSDSASLQQFSVEVR